MLLRNIEPFQRKHIALLIEELYTLIEKDIVLAKYFINVDVATLKDHMRLFFQMVLEGLINDQHEYFVSIRDKHHGLRITYEDFNHFYALFINILNSIDIRYPIEPRIKFLFAERVYAYQLDVINQ